MRLRVTTAVGGFDWQAASGPFRLGRGEHCTLRFEGAAAACVSWDHAEAARAADGTWYLTDLGSSNGTFVDGLRISGPMPIRQGSIVQLGRTGPRLQVLELVAAAPAANQELMPPTIPTAVYALPPSTSPSAPPLAPARFAQVTAKPGKVSKLWFAACWIVGAALGLGGGWYVLGQLRPTGDAVSPPIVAAPESAVRPTTAPMMTRRPAVAAPRTELPSRAERASGQLEVTPPPQPSARSVHEERPLESKSPSVAVPMTKTPPIAAAIGAKGEAEVAQPVEPATTASLPVAPSAGSPSDTQIAATAPPEVRDVPPPVAAEPARRVASVETPPAKSTAALQQLIARNKVLERELNDVTTRLAQMQNQYVGLRDAILFLQAVMQQQPPPLRLLHAGYNDLGALNPRDPAQNQKIQLLIREYDGTMTQLGKQMKVLAEREIKLKGVLAEPRPVQ